MRSLRAWVMTGRDRAAIEKKLVVVATQCIEAGADFDFDALVTEAASLDALRQRFGRVDRLGRYDRAEGVIVWDRSVKDDPIYGEAIANTMAWLKERVAKKSAVIDFGVLALPLPDDEAMTELVAPRSHAPVLLPAYLDLWSQTSPEPAVVPDVSLWLHGPKSGPSDVQVVWRADLSEEALEEAFRAGDGDLARQHAVAIVAAVRPSSLEAMSLPFVAGRRWLSGAGAADIADVDGFAAEDAAGDASRLVLRWNGDDSEVIPSDAMVPGDTIVIPATRGGVADGGFAPEAEAPVSDLAERAALFARGQAVLRLHQEVLVQLGLSIPADDLADARSALATQAQQETGWRRVWLAAVAKGTGSAVVDAPEPWVVLRGRRVPLNVLRTLVGPDETVEAGVETTTDEEDSSHPGRCVSLSEHSDHVERLARTYATAAGLPPALVEDLALAGWLHDVGKADRRFQILLRGGSEIAFYKDETPWAKSAIPPGATGARRVAERKSLYPKGARHEVQSVAMLEHRIDAVKALAHDTDLVLHLVGSHPGCCRPFAPVVVDDDPVEVALAGFGPSTFAALEFGPVSSRHELHRLDSPLADRFWDLVERYGWLELCWLEALLRLADHRASEEEQNAGGDA